MNWYKDRNGVLWSPRQRRRSLVLTKKAIAAGTIPLPSRCCRCGQTEGIIQYHNADYSHPTHYLEELCWRCHMLEHCRHRAPSAVAEYFEAVAAGAQWPPFYRQNFPQLVNDHGLPPGRVCEPGVVLESPPEEEPELDYAGDPLPLFD